MKIIGFIGKAGSGKSTMAQAVAEIIRSQGGEAIILSFAGLLKEAIIKAGILSHDECYDSKTEYSRKMLQLIGTNLVRDQVDQGFWCKAMHRKVRDSYREKIGKQKDLVVLVDDVRFENEADLINQYNGTLIRVVRADRKSDDGHRSETEQDAIVAKATIVNSCSLMEFKQKAREIAFWLPSFTRTTYGDLMNACPGLIFKRNHE